MTSCGALAALSRVAFTGPLHSYREHARYEADWSVWGRSGGSDLSPRQDVVIHEARAWTPRLFSLWDVLSLYGVESDKLVKPKKIDSGRVRSRCLSGLYRWPRVRLPFSHNFRATSHTVSIGWGLSGQSLVSRQRHCRTLSMVEPDSLQRRTLGNLRIPIGPGLENASCAMFLWALRRARRCS
jgi:hypothetical protein